MSKRMTGGKRALLLAAIVLATGACKKGSSATGGTGGGAASGSAATGGTGSGTGGSASGGSGTGGTASGTGGATSGSGGAASGTGGSTSGSGGTGSGTAGSAGGSAGSGATCPQCVDMPFSFGLTGGLVAYTDLSAFAPCGHYAHTRTAAGSAGAKPMQCENDAPCSGAKAVTPGMIADALANADVKMSLTGTVLYGVDTTPSDGSIYQFRIGYNTVQVGSPCSGQSGCKAIPAGVQALVDLLQALDKQQLGLPPCATVFP
jgi:hypothetical protein